MDYEEFMIWADEDTHAEWEDGEVIIFMSTTNVHQMTLDFLYRLLGLFIDLFHLGQLRTAPFQMRLESTGREPDILFIANENLSQLSEDRLNGPADLVVEIISKESIHRDRQTKFREYAEAGVKEYWLIDPRQGRQVADFFRLNAANEYELFATEDDKRVESQVLPGFWLKPDWLWQAGTLSSLAAFLEMRGLSPQQQEQVQNLLTGDSA
jgi:Uma2 family endonuclease